MNINSNTYGGRLTRDCEVRYSQKGTAIVKTGLAMNRRTKKNDEWVDEPVFVDVTMFGKRGEAFARNHGKGDPAIFTGAELAFDQWEDKNGGGKRSKLYIIAFNFEFVPTGQKARVERASAPDNEVPF